MKPIDGGLAKKLISPVLPYDAEIEYLRSTGTQYIDTGHTFTDGFTFEIDFYSMNSNSTVFGARGTTRGPVVYYSITNGLCLNIAGYNGSSTPFKFTGTSISVRHTIKATVQSSRMTTWLDGVKIHDNVSFTGTGLCGVSQAIFGTKYGNNDFRDLTSSSVYSLKMWQGDTLVRDFIPVRVGQVGYLYDKVSGRLFGNIGDGNFILGNDKNV